MVCFKINFYYLGTGEPLHVGMDLTIASFDAISEVNMVSSVSKHRLCV